MTSYTVEARPGARHLTREILIALLTLAAACLITIALAGVLALTFGQLAGKDFVAGDGSSILYTEQRCAEFLQYAPDAASCEEAATEYHFDRVISNRISIGIVGLLALGAARLLRRRRKPEDVPALPYNLVATVATVLFSTAAFGLLAFSVMQLAYSGSAGIGADLAAGIVSAGAFLVAQRHAGRTLIGFGRREEG